MSESDHNSTERFRRLSALLDEALALPMERRADFVARCQPEDLRAELADLLALDDRTGPLDRPPHTLAGEAVRRHSLGRYRLLEPLGEGGMATVWRAEHSEGGFSRQVAVKCLKAGLATPELRARFLREQQILAGLEHPNIARLYDAGISDEGVPFIVMELIDGVPITEYCDRHKLSIRARLKLFRQVLDAVACAHQNLIVHRDLKPANILVCGPDGDQRPESGANAGKGQVRLLDFGIAKALDEQDEATRTQMRALTPGYAAPEQFRGDTVTTATDVYALGVILHELLTGSRPERDTDTDPATAPDPPLASQAVTGEPDETAKRRGVGDSRRLKQALHGDLDTLIAGALRPDPARRYRDAAALDAEIERYLFNLPLSVRRASRAYRTAKFLRRNWLAAGAVTGIAAALVIGTAVALWQAGQARFEAERATIALDETEQALRRAEALQEFLLDLFRSAQPDRPRDQLPTTEEILALGAERALDDTSAPPAERVAMLMTIGQVYREQSRPQQAEPLIHAAVALAREHQDQRPGDLALALLEQVMLPKRPDEFDLVDSLLREAESLVEDSEKDWTAFARVRAFRGWFEILRNDHAQAIRLAEPLYAQILKRDQVDTAVRRQIMNTLATAHADLGNLETAAKLSTDLLEFVERVEGPESLHYAVQLNNSANRETSVGRFGVAESRVRHAIALYDRIYEQDQVTGYRAGARRTLATILMHAGQFEDALAELAIAHQERVAAMDGPLEEWEGHFRERGGLLAQMHYWEDAERDLRKARDLLVTPGLGGQSTLIDLEALLAWTLCRQNKAEEGEALLAELDARLEGQDSDKPLQQAHISEARATCDFQVGNLDRALAEVDSSLALEASYSGYVMQQADRRILRARVLAGLNRHDEAALELNLAQQAFLDLDLSDHPHYSNIETTRQELGLD